MNTLTKATRQYSHALRLAGPSERSVVSGEFWLRQADQALASGRSVTVLLLDIDQLSHVNEAWGFDAGDALIGTLADRLPATVDTAGIVGHLGGGRFAVLVMDSPCEADALAQRLLAAAMTSVATASGPINLSVSAGIAFGPRDGSYGHELLTRAELALKRAKRTGGGGHAVYDAAHIRDHRQRNEAVARLRLAVERREFCLAYQPIVDGSGRTQGAEALLRWKVPGEVLPRPAETIALLEESGLIMEVGNWSLREACHRLSLWRKQLAGFAMHVNLSALQLRSAQLVRQIQAALAEYQLPASALQLEITESVPMERDGVAVGVLRELAALGLRIWIDDFGTGYSSLSYLHRLPISGIKIDRSFLDGLVGCPRRDLLLAVLASLGQSLDLEMVAEGVETLPQAKALRRFHINMQQGYLYGAATAPDRFEELFLR